MLCQKEIGLLLGQLFRIEFLLQYKMASRFLNWDILSSSACMSSETVIQGNNCTNRTIRYIILINFQALSTSLPALQSLEFHNKLFILATGDPVSRYAAIRSHHVIVSTSLIPQVYHPNSFLKNASNSSPSIFRPQQLHSNSTITVVS